MSDPQCPAKGEVVRKIECTGSNLNQYGIKFTEINEKDREAIEEYIKAHSQDDV